MSAHGVAYDAVLVCGGAACGRSCRRAGSPDGVEETVQALAEVVRCSPQAVLVRTDCQGRCSGAAQPTGPWVVLRRADAALRPVQQDTVVRSRLGLVALQAQVARWLMAVRIS